MPSRTALRVIKRTFDNDDEVIATILNPDDIVSV